MRWTETADGHWVYRDISVYSIARIEFVGGQYLLHIWETNRIISHLDRYKTLAEAQAVAIALIAMRDKK